MSQLITDNPIAVFLYAVKSPESKRQYPRRFKMFLDFLGLPGDLQDQAKEFLRNAKTNPKWVQDNLIEFISYQNERAKRGEISVSTIPNYYRATKLFCEMNDIVLVWKKIARGMERVRKAANDRAPTLEEIQHVIEYPDRRIKPIVFTMVSSGIRIGAWDYLRWKHISPISDDKGEVVAAKLLTYAGDPEEYYTFLSPEAYKSLKEWMEFRASYGEKITGESWVEVIDKNRNLTRPSTRLPKLECLLYRLIQLLFGLRAITRSLIQDRFILFQRWRNHCLYHIKKLFIHFKFLVVVVGYDSQVYEHCLLTLELQSSKILSRFFCQS